MQDTKSAGHEKPSGIDIRQQVKADRCAVCELLTRFSAIYSLREFNHRLELAAGTLQPVHCAACGAWFIVEATERPI
jgi:hypothetical protein